MSDAEDSETVSVFPNFTQIQNSLGYSHEPHGHPQAKMRGSINPYLARPTKHEYMRERARADSRKHTMMGGRDPDSTQEFEPSPSSYLPEKTALKDVTHSSPATSITGIHHDDHDHVAQLPPGEPLDVKNGIVPVSQFDDLLSMLLTDFCLAAKYYGLGRWDGSPAQDYCSTWLPPHYSRLASA